MQRSTSHSAEGGLELDGLNLDNSPMHILLGLPSQLNCDYECGLIQPKHGQRISLDSKLLNYDGTMPQDVQRLLAVLRAFEGNSASRVGHRMSTSARPPETDISS